MDAFHCWEALQRLCFISSLLSLDSRCCCVSFLHLCLPRFVLETAIGPSFSGLLPQFSVISLQVLETLLLFLSFLNRLWNEESTVRAQTRLRWERVFLLTGNRHEHRLFLSHVPVPNFVEVQIANVVTLDFAYFLASLVDLTPAEILLTEIVRSELDKPSHPVCLVCVGHRTRELMIHGAYENTIEVVVVLIPADFSAVSEPTLLKTEAVDVTRLETSENLILQEAVHLPRVVRSIRNEVTPRWMMSGLFQVNFCAILSIALICLAEDRV